MNDELQIKIEEKKEIRIIIKDRFEMIAGIIIAIFTAILAINGLAGDSYGQSVILANGEKANVYDWYNTKGIKQTVTEGQKDVLDSLVATSIVKGGNVELIETYVNKLEEKISKYNKEKNEILEGSGNIDQTQWAQDVEGELGKIIGAKEWEKEIDILNQAGAKTDMSDLFLQICLVLGAVSLIMQKPKSKFIFLGSALLIGLAGTLYLISGLFIYWPF